MSTPLDLMEQRLQESFSPKETKDASSSTGFSNALDLFEQSLDPNFSPPEPNDDGEFVKGVKRGIPQTQALIHAGLGAGAQALGFDEFAQNRFKDYTEINEGISRDAAPAVSRVEDINTISDFAKWAAGVTGEQIPFIAGALISGGAGGLAGFIAKGAARRGLQNITEEVALKAAKKAIANSIQKSATAGTFSFASITGTGEIAGEAVDEGLELDPFLAVGGGAIIGALETMPIMTVMKALGLRGGFTSGIMGTIASLPRAKKALALAGVVSGQEAGTEALQSVVENVARSLIDDNFEALGEEGRSRILNGLAAGAVGGFAFGGAGGLVSPRGQIEEDKTSFLSSIVEKPEPKLKTTGPGAVIPEGVKPPSRVEVPDIRHPRTLVETFGIPGMETEEIVLKDVEHFEEVVDELQPQLLLEPPKSHKSFARINYRKGADPETIIIGERPETPNPAQGLKTYVQDSATNTPADRALRFSLQVENRQQRDAAVAALRALGRQLDQKKIDEGEARAKAIVIVKRAAKRSKAGKLTAKERGLKVTKTKVATAVQTATEQLSTGSTAQVTTREAIDPVQQAVIDQDRQENKKPTQSETAPSLTEGEQKRKDRLIEKETLSGLSEREYDVLERLMAKEVEGSVEREAQDLDTLEELFQDENGDFLRQAVDEALSPEGVTTEQLENRAALAKQEVGRVVSQMPTLLGDSTTSELIYVIYSPIRKMMEVVRTRTQPSDLRGREQRQQEGTYEEGQRELAQAMNDFKTAERLMVALKEDGDNGAGLVHRLARNVVFINADRARSKAEVQKTILHEFVVHAGLSRLFIPQELTQFLNAMAQNFNLDVIAEIYKNRDGTPLDIGDFATRRSLEGLTPVQTQNVRGLVEEGLARMAEGDPKTSGWRRIVIWIRQMLRRVFPGLKISDTELRFIAEQTAIALREPIFAQNRYRGIVFPYIKSLNTESAGFKKAHPNLVRGQGGQPLLMFHATNVENVAQLEGERYLYKPFDELRVSARHGVLSTAPTANRAFGHAPGPDRSAGLRNNRNATVEPGKFVYPVYIESKSVMDFENEVNVQKFLKAYKQWRATVQITNPNNIEEEQLFIGEADESVAAQVESRVRQGDWVILENSAVLKLAGFDAVYTLERGKNLHVLSGSQIVFALDLPVAKHLSQSQKIIHATAQGPAKQVSDVLLRIDVLNDEFGRDLSQEGTQAVADIMGLQKLWQMRSMLAFMTPLQLSKKVKLEPVVRYIAAVERWWNTRIGTIQEGSEVVERWRNLGKEQSQKLAKAIFEISIKSDEVGRKLTGEEVALAMSRFKLDDTAKQIYLDMNKGMENLLDRMQLGLEKNAVWEMATEDADATVRAFEAAREKGPAAVEEFYSTQSNAAAIDTKISQITKDFNQLRHRNYFPRSRFGKYAVTGIALKDTEVDGRKVKAGKIGFFATFENVKDQQIALKKFSKDNPGMKWKDGKLADKEFAFLGMPPSLMESIESKLNLDAGQKEALKEIWISLGPGRGFLRHMTKRKGVAGYSEDAMRTYASYMLNVAGHLARLEHHIPLTSELKKLNSLAKLKDPVGTRDPETGNVVQADLPVQNGAGTVLGEVRDYFQTHYEYLMNPGNDLAQIRAMGFLWYLGANPRSAAVNLTQVPMVTYPWLADRFGDGKAVAGIARSYKDVLSSFRNLKDSNFEPDVLRMIAEGMNAGWLDESLAVDLAGIADAPTLERIAPGSAATRTLNNVSYYGAFLFHKAELFNRRVTAVAAFRLALDKGLDYNQAFDTAKDAVQSSQFEYAKWNRAAFMRGKKSVFFLFWNYVQQATFLAFGGENSGTAMRFWGMLLLMAGMQGLPFGDDLMTLYDFMMKKMGTIGGKDPRSSIREDIRNLAGDLGANPDIVMHGLGRYYGLGPMHLLSAVGVPVSNADISASLGLGRVLPGFEDLTGKETDPEKRLARTMVEAGGPVVGVGYNFWRLAFEETPDTWKAWERTLPTAVKNLSKAMRFYGRDAETLSTGAELLSFENRPDRASIIAAQALGFGPTDVAKAYEKRFAQREAAMFYKIRRENLLRDLGWSASLSDREGMADVRKQIRSYNKEVGVPSFRITGAEIKRSLKQKRRRLRLTEAGLPNEKRFRKLYHEVGRNYD